MNSGFFLIDKDEGVSSASVVSKLKKKFNFKKVGHTGTLDPFATGLLVCLRTWYKKSLFRYNFTWEKNW